MNLFGSDEVLSKNPAFSLQEEKDACYYTHKSGQRIITDELGKTLWNNLPGTADEITERVKSELSVSEDLVMCFLYVMLRAELLDSSREKAADTLPPPVKEEHGESLVSVVIITCNSEENIKECLESVVNQSYINLEIMVVDNASKDKTADIIKRDFPQVKLFALERNRYYPGGVNYGLARAEGDCVFILNDDVELEKNCIQHLYRKIMSDEGIGAVAPMLKFYHLRGIINGIGNHVRHWGWGSDNFIGCVDVGQFAKLEEVPSACFGAVLLNRKAVEEVGGLDESYTAYYEDTDWSFRCWLKGWKIVPEVNAIVYHKFGAYWKTMGRKLKFVARNRMRLVLKTFQGRKMLGFIKSYLIEDLKNFFSLLKKKEFSMNMAYIKAYFSIFFSLIDIFWKRRQIMRTKAESMREINILAKNPAHFHCLNQDNIPRIDAEVISSYYLPQLK